VKNKQGGVLGKIAGRPAAMVTFLDGMWIRRPNSGHCAAVGEALARLHLAGADFVPRRANALGPSGWAPLLERCRADGDSVQPGLIAALDAALAGILAEWPVGLPLGHIHADLFPDNVFFMAEAGGGPRVSGIIDFYFACTDLLAYDIAVCLNAWCFEPDFSFNVTRARTLLRAYAAVRPLTAQERAALPVLCRGAALRFLLTRLFDWVNTPEGAMVTRKDPLEYFRKLRFFLDAGNAEAVGG
jgi:homoserine kinase type II